jgi:hypothetical protein
MWIERCDVYVRVDLRSAMRFLGTMLPFCWLPARLGS